MIQIKKPDIELWEAFRPEINLRKEKEFIHYCQDDHMFYYELTDYY